MRKESILLSLKNKTLVLPNGCWEYLGSISAEGYGIIKIQAKTYQVHRLSLWIFKDFDLNSTELACHQVTCKRKDCWNPEHLYAGNEKTNAIDTVMSGNNFNSKKTHCPQGHVFNKKNTGYNYSRSKPYRYCRICSRLNAKNYYKNKLNSTTSISLT